MEMFRLMGIDYGTVRIGIALSDPMRIISKPYDVIPNNVMTISNIIDIIRKMTVKKIILGLPLHPDGGESEKTKEVRNFAELLKQHIEIPLCFWDERYTTQDARNELIKLGYKTKENKKLIDKMSASIILKNYMESQK